MNTEKIAVKILFIILIYTTGVLFGRINTLETLQGEQMKLNQLFNESFAEQGKLNQLIVDKL